MGGDEGMHELVSTHEENEISFPFVLDVAWEALKLVQRREPRQFL